MSAQTTSSAVPVQWQHARRHAGEAGRSALCVRPARVADLPGLAQLLVRCSPRTRLGWYGRGGGVLPLAQQEAWLAEPGALVVEGSPGRLVAVAALRPATCTGEVDPIASAVELLVHDAWQRRGIGSSLVRHLAATSHALGRSEVQVSPLADRVAADRLLVGLAGQLGARPRGQRHAHGRCPRVHVSDRTVGALTTTDAVAARRPADAGLEARWTLGAAATPAPAR